MSVVQSSRFRTEPITLARSRVFRTLHVPHADLVEDRWDESSEHLGMFVDGLLAATFRIVHPACCRLPVSEHLHDVEIAPHDVQFGRFVADSELLLRHPRGSLTCFFLDYFRGYLRLSRRRIFAALLDGGAFSVRRFKAVGFVETGVGYFDSHYGKNLIILVREGDACLGAKLR